MDSGAYIGRKFKHLEMVKPPVDLISSNNNDICNSKEYKTPHFAKHGLILANK